VGIDMMVAAAIVGSMEGPCPAPEASCVDPDWTFWTAFFLFGGGAVATSAGIITTAVGFAVPNPHYRNAQLSFAASPDGTAVRLAVRW
jgi:hypothetical protein